MEHNDQPEKNSMEEESGQENINSVENSKNEVKSPASDGGWGWIVVIASFLCNFTVDGIATSFGILLEPLVRDFESNRSTVSWIGSLMIGVYNLSGPIVSISIKKFGARAVIIFGALLSCAAILLSTLSPNVYVLLFSYGIVGGFGAGMIYFPSVVIVGYYFESKRSLATGIATCGSGVGSFVVPILANYILTQFQSWISVFIMFGIMCFNCTIFGSFMKPLNSEEKLNANDKNTEQLDEIAPKKSTNVVFNLVLLRDLMFILYCLASAFGSLGYYVPFVFLSDMAEQSGITKENANWLLSIIGISNTLGRVMVGYISDHKWINTLLVTILSMIMCGTTVIIMPESSSYGAFVALAISFGFFLSAIITLQSIDVVYLFGLGNLTDTFGYLKLFIGVSSNRSAICRIFV